MAGGATPRLLPHGRADAGRERADAHAEEGPGQEAGRKRLGGAGEVGREPVRVAEAGDYLRNRLLLRTGERVIIVAAYKAIADRVPYK